MKSINRVQLLGHLGSDPEMKTIDKTTIANFSLATSCLTGYTVRRLRIPGKPKPP